MLPSKGEFRSLNCPFYDSGLCVRPYCHFRHHDPTPDEDTASPTPAYTPTPLAELSRRRARRHIPVVACTSINVYHPGVVQRKRRPSLPQADDQPPSQKPCTTPPPSSYNFYIGNEYGTGSPPLMDVDTIVRRAKQSLQASVEDFGRRKPAQTPHKPFYSYYGSNVDDEETRGTETVGFYGNVAGDDGSDTRDSSDKLKDGVDCDANKTSVVNNLNHFGFEDNLREPDETNEENETPNSSSELSADVYGDGNKKAAVNNVNNFGLEENLEEIDEPDDENETPNSNSELSADVYGDGKEKAAVNNNLNNFGFEENLREIDEPDENETPNSSSELSADVYGDGKEMAAVNNVNNFGFEENLSKTDEIDIPDTSSELLGGVHWDKNEKEDGNILPSITTTISIGQLSGETNTFTESESNKSQVEETLSPHPDRGPTSPIPETLCDVKDPSPDEHKSKHGRGGSESRKHRSRSSVSKNSTSGGSKSKSRSEHGRHSSSKDKKSSTHKASSHGEVSRKDKKDAGKVKKEFVGSFDERDSSSDSEMKVKTEVKVKEEFVARLDEGDAVSPAWLTVKKEPVELGAEVPHGFPDPTPTMEGGEGEEVVRLPCSLHLSKLRGLTDKPSAVKVRIAHVPNVARLLAEREKLRRLAEEARTRRTDAQITAPRRVAHVPARQREARPIITPQLGAKVPTTARQRKLDLLVDEYLERYESSDAYRMAVEREREVYARATSFMTYSSLASSAILKVRQELDNERFWASIPQVNNTQPNKPGGIHASLKPPSPVPKLDPIYSLLERFILTESQLVDNGFPRADPEREGSALVKLRYGRRDEPVTPFIRRCARCGTRYAVNALGAQAREEACLYHERSTPRAGKFGCCNGGLDSPGCRFAATHVCDNFQATNYGFRRTPDPSGDLNGDPGVYAVDCEMSYTTLGVELTRVTLVMYNIQ